jgi:hypothetical protein
MAAVAKAAGREGVVWWGGGGVEASRARRQDV